MKKIYLFPLAMSLVGMVNLYAAIDVLQRQTVPVSFEWSIWLMAGVSVLSVELAGFMLGILVSE